MASRITIVASETVIEYRFSFGLLAHVDTLSVRNQIFSHVFNRRFGIVLVSQ